MKPHVAVYVLVVASAALADTSPTVVAAPLDVHRSPSSEVTTALQKHLRILLMKEREVLTPTPSAWDAAIVELKRQDCDVSDDCLRQLAVTSGTLYAIYAAVELDLTKTNVIAVGRIVRRDGVLMEVDGQKTFRVQVLKGKDSFEATAKVALAQLVATMRLSQLSASIPVDVRPPPEHPTPDAGVEASKPDGGVEFPPPPMPLPVDEGEGQRTAGKVFLGAGVGIAAVGAVLGIVGVVNAGAVKPVDGAIPPEQLSAYQTATVLRPTGLIVGGVGVAAAALGAILWATAPAAPVKPALVPQPGGAMFVLSGDLP